MHPDIAAQLQQSGFVTRPQFLTHGLDDHVISTSLRAKEIVRVGPGLYVASGYTGLSPEEQHVLRAKAVATRFGDDVVFTHQTAALVHGLPVWGVDLDDVHVTRVDGGRGRHQAHVAHHVGEIQPTEITGVDGLLVSSLSRTCWDLACAESTESALVTIDAALHSGALAEQELVPLAHRYVAWRGSRHAKVALKLADSGSESVGESRSRYIFHAGGLPKPDTQFKIYDERGVLIGVSDFAWEESRHLAEFDGMLKYQSTLDLAKEKAREDRLRRAGWGITRIVWSQLSPSLRPTLIAELRRAMAESERQFTRRAS